MMSPIVSALFSYWTQ